MKKLIGKIIVMATLLTTITGCGTITGVAKCGPQPFLGVSRDAAALATNGPFALLDMPLSLAADIAVLPVSIIAPKRDADLSCLVF